MNFEFVRVCGLLWSLVVLASCVINPESQGQLVCSRLAMAEWLLEPQTSVVRWSLTAKTCSSAEECWGPEEHRSTPLAFFPQMCPIMLQLGDKLLVSADDVLESYGINLVNVSKESFGSCSTSGPSHHGLLFATPIKGTVEVDSKWLPPGTHYLAAVRHGSTVLCRRGLRLSVTVKDHRCLTGASQLPCMGNGACRAGVSDETFTCYCRPPYLGRFCERFDGCSDNPCPNGTICISRAPLSRRRSGYECLCPPRRPGVNCSEVLHLCQKRCLNARWKIITPNSSQCLWSPGYTGPTCAARLVGEAFLQERACNGGDNSSSCVEKTSSCDSNLCLNNSSCTLSGDQYHCRCLPGYTGRRCEGITDYCTLLGIDCLNAGLCLSVIGGYRCLCAPGWTGEICQHVDDACRVYPSWCQNGATCVDSGQQGAPPKCACLHGYTGLRCEMSLDECLSPPCEDGPGGFCGGCTGSLLGPRCETGIEECVSSPCLGGGCKDALAGCRRRCEPGWTGDKGDSDIDECESSPCLNGGSCVDGPGLNFTCSCPAGFAGASCELEVSECSSEPCINGAICQNLVDAYLCRCQPAGWTGLGRDDDVNECLPEPCVQGVCVQGRPRCGCTCFCHPGFVTCPPDHYCVDGNNTISRVPTATGEWAAATVTAAPRNSGLQLPSLSSTSQAGQPSDFAWVSYSGESFLEFEVIHFTEVNISLKFKTQAQDGTILYGDEGSVSDRSFFIKLFIHQGLLQYAFSCTPDEGPRRMNTSVQVHVGTEYTAHVRQRVAPCEAEVTVFGHRRVRSGPSSAWVGLAGRRTTRLLVGGMPLSRQPVQGAEPFSNYTGCIEIMDINRHQRFHVSDGISGTNVADCSDAPQSATPTPMPPRTLTSACEGAPCLNGGTCRALRLSSGAGSFSCDCALHFSGRLCERDTTIFFPSFHGDSYLELPPLTSLLEPHGVLGVVTLFLMLKSESPNGTILFSQERNSGRRFLHVFLRDGRPTVRLCCGAVSLLTRTAAGRLSRDQLTPVVVRFSLPANQGRSPCTVDIEVSDSAGRWQQTPPSRPESQVELGPIFLGGLPYQAKLHHPVVGTGLVGCIKELQVNTRELYIVDEALRGRNVRNCYAPICQQEPCRNGGTCISDAENWFCRCPTLYTGRVCQFRACTRDPCQHGGTCVPQSSGDIVCLCPYGRTGLFCQDAISITRPRFGGTDNFGHSSFMAYPPISSSSFFYEFTLKLTFARRASAFKNNLILFTGQKGHGVSGDDFLALGVWRGRIVHRFNLGSGVGTIISAPLTPRGGVHVVHFGRSFRTGWLKVDNQRNRTGSSPGPLVSLNAFSWLYVGGFSEQTPELLPPGSRFQKGFQGCIFDLRLRTRWGTKFQAPGGPKGQPVRSRGVGQCGVSPCTMVRCRNGGTCQCPSSWKGALYSETLSACDPEHVPPPSCAHGSTCVPLLDGYSCQCPLGTTGALCEQALTISDPFFNGTRSSWMSFPLLGVRHRTEVELQFQTLSPEGLLLYTAQHVSHRAGDFFSLSLACGFVQMRYNLGDRTMRLQSTNQVDTAGRTWHTVRAGRQDNQGYLVLDGREVRLGSSLGMTALDVHAKVFIGGVPTLITLPDDAMEDEPTGFTGCIREVVVNGHELDLSEKGALDGADVGDCDGTSCGFKVCKNQGLCTSGSSKAFTCTCPPLWGGPTCSVSVFCVDHLCQQGSSCVPHMATASYSCSCPLGWEGAHCDKQTSITTAVFLGNSYLKHTDPKHAHRNLSYTKVAFNFTSHSSSGLVLWMGKDEDEDYLAAGLHDGHLRLAVNLGEGLSVPLIHRGATLCCDEWHYLEIIQNRTAMRVFIDEELVVFEDTDPLEQYVELNYGGVFYFGGFELYRDVSKATRELFSQGFVGKLKDVHLYDDLGTLQFLQSSEGMNVYEGD